MREGYNDFIQDTRSPCYTELQQQQYVTKENMVKNSQQI